MFLVEIRHNGVFVGYERFTCRQFAINFVKFHNAMSVTRKAVHAW